MRLKLTQTTVKYFIVTAVSYSSGTGLTTVTVFGGSNGTFPYTSGGYSIANAAISANYHSTSLSPAGFPCSPAIWSIGVQDTTGLDTESPTQSQWYPNANCSLAIPIGVWTVRFKVNMESYKVATGSTDVFATLSTGNNNTESNPECTVSCSINYAATNPAPTIQAPAVGRIFITAAAATTYYMKHKTSIASVGNLKMNLSPYNNGYIIATCAYL